jgi:hypothetical protein
MAARQDLWTAAPVRARSAAYRCLHYTAQVTRPGCPCWLWFPVRLAAALMVTVAAVLAGAAAASRATVWGVMVVFRDEGGGRGRPGGG